MRTENTIVPAIHPYRLSVGCEQFCSVPEQTMSQANKSRTPSKNVRASCEQATKTPALQGDKLKLG
jgi:hypothetical protein